MSKRLFRFGAWFTSMMLATSVVLNPLAQHVSAANPDESASFSTQAVTGIVVLNEIVSWPTSGNQEFIELYNMSNAATQDLNGWSVLDQNGATVATISSSTILQPGGHLAVFLSSQLSNTEGGVSLKSDTGTIVDRVFYGVTSTANLRPAGQGNSLARLGDGGGWFSHVASVTPNGNNPVFPGFPSVASVTIPATSTNPAQTVNHANQASVVTQVTLASGTTSATSLQVDLVDSSGTTMKTNGRVVDNGTTVAIVTLDTTSTPGLGDGAGLTLRAFTTNPTTNVSSSYTPSSPVVRDTVAPSAPSETHVAAGTNNERDIVNTSNTQAASVTSVMGTGTASGDAVVVIATDGTRTVTSTGSATTAGTTVTVSSVNVSTLADGIVSVATQVIDRAGNSSTTSTATAVTKDTNLPAASLFINNGATVTATNTVSLVISASDIGTGLKDMRLANTSDFAGSSFEAFANMKSWTLASGEGMRTVYLQVRDNAGNVSTTATDEILVESDAENINQYAVASGTQTIRQLPSEVTLTATSPTSLTFANYRTNPGTTVFPDGLSSLGKYVEIGVAEPSKITFPVLLKIYYTTADLTAAGMTSEQQLKGIGFFDPTTQSWKLYSSTGVTTADITVDGQQFAGYLYANADHLTPMTGFGDTTPPPAPSDFTVTTGDGFAFLSWSAVSGADSYVISYHRSDRPVAEQTVVVVSGATTSTKIVNLENGVGYNFGLASQDATGNRSSFAVLAARPVAPTPTPAPTLTPEESPVVFAPGTSTPARSSQPRSTPNASPTGTPTPTSTSTPDTDSDEDDEDGQRGLNRLLVTLAILIIAIGAVMAGYYGYQWWSTPPAGSKPVVKVTPPGARPTPPVATPPPPTAAPVEPTAPVSTEPLAPTEPAATTPPETKPTEAPKKDTPPDGRW